MSDLGDLLKLLHDAHTQLGTLEAEYREWTKPRPSVNVSVERGESGVLKIDWRQSGPFPRTLRTTRRIWLRAPGCARVEVVTGRELVKIGVRDGAGWRRWDRAHGVMSGDLSEYEGGRSMMAPPLLFSPLIEPARLLGALSFELAGKGTRLGREVLVARALPRYASSSTETVEFEFDAEHGTILRRTTLDGDQPVSETEAVAVRYQIPIEQSRFELRPPDSHPVARSTTGRVSSEERWSEKAARVPDEEFIPSRPPSRRPRAFGDDAGSRRVTHSGTIWLTGISGAGKTTLARCLTAALAGEKIPSCVIDGDDMREGLSNDLEFSRADRAEQARRAAHVARLLSHSGILAVVALITPYESDRQLARAVHRERDVPFFEVWVDTPVEVCAQRDVKGLYARARSGDIYGLPAIDAPYERPLEPDMRVAGYGQDAVETATAILARAMPMMTADRWLGTLQSGATTHLDSQ